MNTRTITINPITRLEGHDKIEIFLNEEGNVENAYFQVPESRGFERFWEGRKDKEEGMNMVLKRWQKTVLKRHEKLLMEVVK